MSWRLFGTITTAVLVFVFTGRPTLALFVGTLEFVSKICLFWLHERLWDKVAFGRREARASVVWFTGLSGAGKTTIATRVARDLRARGFKVEHLDGDTVRELFPQTGFGADDRNAHVRRVGFLASKLAEHGVIVIASLISPYRESRAFVRDLCSSFVEVYVSTPLDICEQRDVKGLYARARRGEIAAFTGVNDPYEPPTAAEVVLDTSAMSESAATSLVLDEIHRRMMPKPRHKPYAAADDVVRQNPPLMGIARIGRQLLSQFVAVRRSSL